MRRSAETTLYRFHDLSLEVRQEGPATGLCLFSLLHDLSFVKLHKGKEETSLCLSIRMSDQVVNFPGAAWEVFRMDGLCGREQGSDFYLTEGTSVLHLQVLKGEGEATLASSFFQQPPLLQQHFWGFGLLKLLRPVGLYGLHAAGVVSPTGLGLLVVGESGCGKSTLAIQLIREGWCYLSDDTVLLRLQPEGVESLAFRKPFSISTNKNTEYAELPLGGENNPHPPGKKKRRVDIQDVYPEQYVTGCVPQMVIFPRIIPELQSTLHPIGRLSALGRLLSQSGPQLFDKMTMPHHLKVLNRLVSHCQIFELRAGLDLYREPGTFGRLVSEAKGRVHVPDCD
ncbi:MAG: hypothetical protein KC588_05750 [Nitrospira sp.]|nr:hypothetical protein [Nitrospira sp.]